MRKIVNALKINNNITFFNNFIIFYYLLWCVKLSFLIYHVNLSTFTNYEARSISKEDNNIIS